MPMVGFYFSCAFIATGAMFWIYLGQDFRLPMYIVAIILGILSGCVIMFDAKKSEKEVE